jgi:hypothetical protein
MHTRDDICISSLRHCERWVARVEVAAKSVTEMAPAINEEMPQAV